MTKKPRPRKPMTDKWIVGMIDNGTIKMFHSPRVYTDYDTAVAVAEANYGAYGKHFVVFAKKCVIGPTRPPAMKTEYLA